MTYRGKVKQGKVELEQGVNLPDGTVVRVEPITSEVDPAYRISEEAVSTGIKDLASQHDHYAWDTPKRKD